MKSTKTFLLVGLLLLLTHVEPVCVFSQTQIQHTVHLISDSLSFDMVNIDSLFFTKVNYAHELGRICDTGSPELPVVFYSFILPQNKTVNQITLTNKVYAYYSLGYPIFPAQEPQSLCIDCPSPDFCLPNQQIYGLTTAFPSNSVISIEQNFFDGNRILTVGVCPFEYYPSTGQFNMLTSFGLNINLVSDTVQHNVVSVKRLEQSQELYDRLLHGLVENKEQVETFKNTPIFVNEIGDTPSGLAAYEYVVVTSSQYSSAFSDFIEWKKQKGIDVGIVTIEDILSHYSGDEIFQHNEIYDNAGKLRQYLYEARNQGMVYALLAGDLPLFPIRYGWAINNVLFTDTDNVIPTDLYFADFDGNWNVDGDTCYGELGLTEADDDATDFLPDIFLGRLICSSSQEISNWVTKTLLYEKDPGQGNPSYLLRSFMTESDQPQKDREAETVASHLSMFNHTIWKETPNYDSEPPVFPKGSDVIDELNSTNYGLVSWFNHGGTGNGESGIATMTSQINHYPQWKLQAQEGHPYNNAQPDYGNGLDNLSNSSKPFILYSISCSVCPFDKTNVNNYGARNCGESFTVNNLAGGIAFFGNCRKGWQTFSKNIYVEFAKTISEYSEEGEYPRFGILENKSRSSCCYTWKQKYLCYSHNLIGDPECGIWTNTPRRLDVTVLPQTAVLNNTNCFQVTINGLDFNKKAVVTLYKEGELWERAEVVGNQDNNVVANFNGIVPTTFGQIVITVTSFGYLPYQEYITVGNECQIVINDTQVWHSDDAVGCDIVINDNASLYVLSGLCMAPNTRIIVKPGGRLYVDGGKITSSCSNEMWQGIEVWGNSSLDQKEVSGCYSQGYVELKNGAIIENAVCAVELWRPQHWNTTGGIIKANDAIFHNCARAVHALYYRNVYPNGLEHDYEANFTRCAFIVDGDYIGNENQVFYKHVDLNHVRGLQFKSCAFSVAPSVDNVSYWSYGIQGNEAGFTVKSICISEVEPCPDYIESTFNGFFAAINAVGSGSKSVPGISVTRASFTNNDFGVFMKGLDYSLVKSCDFDVKRNGYWPCGVGVLSEQMSYFCIEDNVFNKTNTYNGNGYGIIINNSAGQNTIYRNHFEKLYCGNLAYGNNFLMSSSNNYLGLEYRCNTNLHNTIDFYVQKDNSCLSGIQSSQGSDVAAARNTFSENGYHFYNEGDHIINYYYYDEIGFEDEEPLYNNQVSKHASHQTDNCPRHGNRSGDDDNLITVLTPSTKQQLEQEYYEAYGIYRSLKSVYDQRVDGGNTSNMLAEINNAQIEDMWRLRSDLLGNSPYVSEEVLFATSDRDDVFSESVLFEILLANPDELKKDSLRNYIKTKDNPLPQYMTDILDQVANGTSSKTVLQNSMANFRNIYSRAACDIVRSIINDTVLDINELRGWLGNLEDIHADRDIIATYVDEGDFNNALTLARLLPSLYGLTGKDLVEHEDYLSILELYQDLFNSGRNNMQLDSTEIVFVRHIADYGTGYPQAMAQNILREVEGNSNFEGDHSCPSLSLGEGRTSNTIPETSLEGFGKALGLNAIISPNPASNWVSIDYTLPINASKATISIANTFGVIVISEELYNRQGQKVIDLRGLANGVYVYTIRSGEFVCSGKLIVTK